jgi:uncharacterized protein (TIGR02147 family)
MVSHSLLIFKKRMKSKSEALLSIRLPLKEFSNYREYLEQYIARQRESGVHLTNRRFAELVGVASSSWLTMLLQGKKGLSPETTLALSKLIGHDSWEQEYFDTLVRFNQAKLLDERNRYLEKLNDLRKSRGVTSSVVISDAQHEFYSRWYYTAIRSLIGLYRLGDDYDRIAKMVSPHSTPRQAKKAIKLLVKLKMIQFNGSLNCYELTGQAISTGRHEYSLAIANFQRESMRLGIEALDRYKPGVRDISSVSVGVSAQTAQKIKDEITALRRKIVDMANNDPLADQVVQVNFQVFPLSDPLNCDGLKKSTNDSDPERPL